YGARVDYGNESAAELSVLEVWAAAVNGRVDHFGAAAQVLVDVIGGVVADRDNCGRVSDQFSTLAVRVPAGRAERIELRCVRQVNDTPGSRVVRRSQQALADVLRRNQHPVRLKFVNLMLQNRGAFDGVRYREVLGRSQLD